jgi:hypothetical protein
MRITLERNRPLREIALRSLVLPSHMVPYEIACILRQSFPDLYVLEHSIGILDIDDYINDNKLESLAISNFLEYSIVEWNTKKEIMETKFPITWQMVFWKERWISWLRVEWHDNCCAKEYLWLLGEDPTHVQDFFREMSLYANRDDHDIWLFQREHWQPSKELAKSIAQCSFENLILPPAMKSEIIADFKRFSQSRARYEVLGVPWQRGVLFLGPPGNGKSHTIKALANMAERSCLVVKSLQSSDPGEHRAIERVFEFARRKTPCLLVFEDIDSLISDRNRSYFLNELDGFASNTGIEVIATSNHPETLDSAILERPSRFDRHLLFSNPAEQERLQFLTMWNQRAHNELRVSDTTLRLVAQNTHGFSYAYLKELLLTTHLRWLHQETVFSQPAEVLHQELERMEKEMLRLRSFKTANNEAMPS